MATCSSSGLQSMGSQRVGHDWERARTHTHPPLKNWVWVLCLFSFIRASSMGLCARSIGHNQATNTHTHIRASCFSSSCKQKVDQWRSRETVLLPSNVVMLPPNMGVSASPKPVCTLFLLSVFVSFIPSFYFSSQKCLSTSYILTKVKALSQEGSGLNLNSCSPFKI